MFVEVVRDHYVMVEGTLISVGVIGSQVRAVKTTRLRLIGVTDF